MGVGWGVGGAWVRGVGRGAWGVGVGRNVDTVWWSLWRHKLCFLMFYAILTNKLQIIL